MSTPALRARPSRATSRDLPRATRPPGGPGAGPVPLTVPLVEIAAGLAAARGLWRGAARHDPDRRHFTQLLATGEYDAWVIGWWPGQGVALHDHGGSSGAVVVVEGHLRETTAGAGAAPRTRDVGVGESFTFGPGHLHAVANLADVPATSIHVYAPPLRSMTFYDVDARGVVPGRVEAVGP